MQEEQEQLATHARRRHERVWFKYQAVLELVGGKTFWGITRDVSLRGLFLNTTGVPIGIQVGDTGVLRLTVLNLKKEFPCRIAHVTGQGIGIELFEHGENFGATLTASLLQETQVRLGADVDSSDHIRIALRRPPNSVTSYALPEARLIKISVSHMDFSFDNLSGWSLKAGDALKLEIVRPRQTPIAVDGVVRSVLSANFMDHQRADEKVCSVIFSVLSNSTTESIKELVRSLHARRLQQMLVQRSTSIGLQSGSDLPRRTRPTVRRDLVRFFGVKS